MAKIQLSNATFSLVPEGTHVFEITAVEYKEDFGKLNITMKTSTGATHIERFSFVNSNGEPNEGAINAFSYLAKTALQDFDLEEIDHDDLVGCFIKAEVTHDVLPNKNDPSKTVTFSRLGNKYTADGFEDDEPPKPAVKPVTTPKPVTKPAAKPIPKGIVTPAATTGKPRKIDLSEILGRKK